MPTPVRKKFCTIYHRSDFERRAFDTSKELNKTKKELEELKAEMAEIRKAMGINTNTNLQEDSVSPKRSRKKASE